MRSLSDRTLLVVVGMFLFLALVCGVMVVVGVKEKLEEVSAGWTEISAPVTDPH